MRAILLFLTFGLVVASSSQVALAATTKAKSKKAQAHKVAKKVAPRKESAELSTDVKFGDLALHGQYQTPDEALAKVENEKGLSDLLGVRKHFKDRLATAAEQE